MTQTELANIALDLLGAEQITDFTDRTPVAEKIRRHWPLVRDALLRSKNWNFATRRVALSADEDNAPDFDWTYAYALPADYVKAVEFNGKQAGTGESEFEIAGRFLLSDDTTAELKYTARVETVSFWDPSFQDAFAHALAAALAPGLSTAPGLGLAMRQRAEEITVQAAGPNAVETRPRTVLAQTGSGWLNARLGGSGESAEPSTTPATTAPAPAVTTITLSGDATGSGTTSIAVTLIPSGVSAGSYTFGNFTVDDKGRITAASNGTAFNGTVGATTPNTVAATTGAFSSTITQTTLSLGATPSTPGLTLINSTAAVNGTQQASPPLQMEGRGFATTGSLSVAVAARIWVLPVQGSSSPTGTIKFQFGIGGSFSDVMTVGSDSAVTIGVSGPVLTPNAAATGSLSIKNGATSSIWINANDVRLTSGLTIGWSSDATNAFNGTKDTLLGRKAAANLRQGDADAVAPVAQTFSVQNVATGNSNVIGVSRTISGCQSTGDQNGGNIIFSTSSPGGSGSSQNALSAALTIKGDTERCVEVEKLLSIVARAVSTLPSAATYAGCCANVNDASGPTAGATVAGGGAARALVWSDGTNWKVVIA